METEREPPVVAETAEGERGPGMEVRGDGGEPPEKPAPATESKGMVPVATSAGPAQACSRKREREEGATTTVGPDGARRRVEAVENDEGGTHTRKDVCYILGDSSSERCSYDRGYIRQPIFACLTCYPNGGCGFCLACSLKCHDGHLIEELYTKRNFRCDCRGPVSCESESKEVKCCLLPNKERSLFQYNKNFRGLYCTCNRSYPDPTMTDDEQNLTQCVVCEDWFHEKCVTPKPNQFAGFDEMICAQCASNFPFLYLYSRNRKEFSNDAKSSEPCNENLEIDEKTGSTEEGKIAGKCFSEMNIASPPAQYLYFNLEWRTQICRCAKCIQTLGDFGISFLADLGDSITSFEKRGQKKLENDALNLITSSSASSNGSSGSRASLSVGDNLNRVDVLNKAFEDELRAFVSRGAFEGLQPAVQQEVAVRIADLRSNLTHLLATSMGQRIDVQQVIRELLSQPKN